MKIAVAKEVFDAGGFESAEILKKPMGDGWIVALKKTDKTTILSNDRGTERTFKTIEAAYKTIRSIGFKNAEIKE